MSNNDLLLQYTREQDELCQQIYRALEADNRTHAAWVLHLNMLCFSVKVISIAVSDTEYAALSASLGQREDFVRSIGSWPVLLSSYVDPPMRRIPATDIRILHSGQVVPHSICYQWWPLSIASIPSEGHRILYDRVGLPHTGQYRGYDRSNIRPKNTPDEQISENASWFWAALWTEVAALFEDYDEPFAWTWTALNVLEVSLNLPITSEKERVVASRFSHNLVTARELTARGAFLTDKLRLKGIDAPSADIFVQMNRLIRFVAEVEPRKLRARC